MEETESATKPRRIVDVLRLARLRADEPYNFIESLWSIAGKNVGLQEAVEEFLRPMTPRYSVMLWTEEPGRTKAEILSLLDRAIPRADRIEDHDGYKADP